jgi:anti-sigma-K factor RskA
VTLQEIRVSGLLELYAIGALSEDEKIIVEETIEEYPQLKEDLIEISLTLESYARIHKIDPPEGIKNNILEEAAQHSGPIIPAKHRKTATQTNKSHNKSDNSFLEKIPVWPIAASLFFLSTLGLWYQSWSKNNKHSAELVAFEEKIQACEDQKLGVENQLMVLNAITSSDNQIVAIAATKNYPTASLLIHNNNSSKKNYLQLSALPALSDNQSFQLWSLKADQDPIPLDVFDGTGDRIIEVQHINGTETYAITIEPKGGSKIPTLENLIGTFSLQG